MYLQKSNIQQIKEFHDIIELPWKRSFLSLMRSTYLEDLIKDETIVYSKKNNEFILRNWEKIKKLTLVDPFRMGGLIDLLEQVKDIDGDIVECGSYKGGSGILMGLWLKENKIDKKIHLLDSFSGLPDPDIHNDKGYKKGQFKSNYDLVVEEVAKNGLSDIITIHKGWFSETVPALEGTTTIALLHVDCDLYTSTKDCFPQLYPSVSAQGAIVFDDFNDGGGGEKKAVHEYLKQNKLKETIHIGPAPQSHIIKGETCSEELLVGEFYYSKKIVQQNKEYLGWLIENFDLHLIDQINEIKSIEV